MNILEFHVLLALAGGPLYGYAIKDAVAADSGGAETPRAGSLYRVIARLVAAGLVRETNPPDEIPAHPGHERRASPGLYEGLATRDGANVHSSGFD